MVISKKYKINYKSVCAFEKIIFIKIKFYYNILKVWFKKQKGEKNILFSTLFIKRFQLLALFITFYKIFKSYNYIIFTRIVYLYKSDFFHMIY